MSDRRLELSCSEDRGDSRTYQLRAFDDQGNLVAGFALLEVGDCQKYRSLFGRMPRGGEVQRFVLSGPTTEGET